MKLMIASDLHGSAFFARALTAAFDREQPARLLLLGDLLYHGPRNDLPREYAPKEVIALLAPLREKLLCVRGNCDCEVDQMVLPFPMLADYAAIFWGTRVLYATHGHVYNAQNPPPLVPGDILLSGHTHVPAWDALPGGGWALNPGSAAIPKGGSAAAYMTLDGDVARWKSLESGEVFHTLAL